MKITQKIQSLEIIIKHLNSFPQDELLSKILEIDQSEYQQIQQQKSQGNKNICFSTIELGQICYRCFDCQNNENHLYCQACLDPEKHKNHLVTYIYTQYGFCDCGDENCVNKDSFCDKHQSDNMEIINNNIQIIQIDEKINHKYRLFIQISFAMFFKRIEQLVDYTSGFKVQIADFIDSIDDEELLDFFVAQLDDFNRFDQIAEEIQILYQLNTDIIKELTKDSISLSLLTSQLLQQPIDEDIQQIIAFHHEHNQKFKVSSQKQLCKCSILELYVKFNGFLYQIIPKNKRHFTEIFFNLFIDNDFKPYLSRLTIKYLHNLILPIKKYQFQTQHNGIFKLEMKAENYSDQKILLKLFEKISSNCQIITTITKNDILILGDVLDYQFQGQGSIVFQVLKLQNEQNSKETLKNFTRFFRKMIQLPIYNYSSVLRTTKFLSLIESWFTFETLKGCYQQIMGFISEDEQFLSKKALVTQTIFTTLKNKSILIYFFTRAFSFPICDFEKSMLENKAKYYVSFQECSIDIFCAFRNLLSRVITIWNENLVFNNMGLQNIMKIILNYLIHQKQIPLVLHPNNNFVNLMTNSVASDRNFILVLSVYLLNFNENQDTYNDLLEVSQNDPIILKQVMFNTLRRTLLNYLVFQTEGNTQIYKGQVKQYMQSCRYNEVALEQIDITFMQLYAFIFGADGINDIITQFQIIGSSLSLDIDSSNLIARICQSDYDMIQCQGFNQKNKLTEEGVKGLNKLFQTIFFAQTFYNTKDLIILLKQFSYDTNFDIQSCVLSSCELNPDNDSLQLKKSLLPAQYEPVFAQQVPSLKEKIDDKLKTEGDYFKQLFGSALANELSNKKSTLTFKRLAILKAIVLDEEQQILKEIIQKILTHYNCDGVQKQNQKSFISFLEEKAVYINLLFQSNNAFGPNKVIQQGLQQLQKIISQIVKEQNIKNESSVFFNYLLLLDESSILNLHKNQEQQTQKQELKKQQLQKKFQFMNKQYQSYIKDDIQIEDNEQCSFCKLNFNQNEQQYKAVLIQQSNIHDYHKLTQNQKKLPFDILSTDMSCCGHLFHENCLRDNFQSINFGNFTYIKCPVCYMPFNFFFLNPFKLKTFNNQKLQENLNDYFKIVGKEYDSNDNFQKVVVEIFTCCLCNLLIKLLGNTVEFYSKKYHSLLQEVIHLLRLAKQEDKQSTLDFANLNTKEILFGLLNAILIYLVAAHSLNEFENYLKQKFDENQYLIVLNLILKQRIDKNLQSLQIYNQEAFKEQLKSHYLDLFQEDFKQFLIKHNLKPCQKKRCKLRAQYLLEGKESEQYFCLICIKKMCSLHCGVLSNTQGNLIRHAIKRHNNKTIYLQISSSKIILMIAPHILHFDQTLYQSLISEQPVVGTYGSSYYETFKFNQKAITMIVDIISEEKYLQKMFANISKTEANVLL